MTKKTKEVKSVSVKEMKEYIVGPGIGTDEVVSNLMEGKPFVRKGSEKCWTRRRLVLGDLPGSERIGKISQKDGKRGQVCKILCEKGEISRDDYKKFNAWGDIRFIKDFVNEEVREGVTFYVLKEDVKKELESERKGKKGEVI